MSAAAYVSGTAPELRTLWRTDPRLVDAVRQRFGPLHVDASASPGAAIPGVLAQITPADDALGPRAWSSYAPASCRRPAIWLNCPWGGRGLTARWIDRAIAEADRGAGRVIVLVPESTDSGWWWRLARRALAVYSLGRIGYLNAAGELVTRVGFGSSLFYLRPGDVPGRDVALIEWRDAVPPTRKPRRLRVVR